jgi:hypothetical protein
MIPIRSVTAQRWVFDRRSLSIKYGGGKMALSVWKCGVWMANSDARRGALLPDLVICGRLPGQALSCLLPAVIIKNRLMCKWAVESERLRRWIERRCNKRNSYLLFVPMCNLLSGRA